jgi:hypothetical protein
VCFRSGDVDGGEADFLGDLLELGDGREAAAIGLGLGSTRLGDGRGYADGLRASGLGRDKRGGRQGEEQGENPE